MLIKVETPGDCPFNDDWICKALYGGIRQPDCKTGEEFTELPDFCPLIDRDIIIRKAGR